MLRRDATMQTAGQAYEDQFAAIRLERRQADEACLRKEQELILNAEAQARVDEWSQETIDSARARGEAQAHLESDSAQKSQMLDQEVRKLQYVRSLGLDTQGSREVFQ